MKQINNGFLDFYYLTDDGKVYNSKNNCYLKADRNIYTLKTCDNKNKKISLKSLYYLVYGKNYCIDNIQNLNCEIWKEINRTNGIYFISNYGRIKSLKGYYARLLQPWITNNGYYRIDIVQENQRTTKLVHCLVAEAFLYKPKEIDNLQVHHIDNNKINNSAINLVYLSAQQHSKLHKKQKEIN